MLLRKISRIFLKELTLDEKYEKQKRNIFTAVKSVFLYNKYNCMPDLITTGVLFSLEKCCGIYANIEEFVYQPKRHEMNPIIIHHLEETISYYLA